MSAQSYKMKQCALCLAIVAMFTLTGFKETKQVRGPMSGGVQESGFLGDLYSVLADGAKGQALKVYRSPTIDELAPGAYNKVYMDRVTMYFDSESKMNNLPPEQLQALADLFAADLALELYGDYELVKESGPNTLLLQIAITDVKRTKTGLKALSFIPFGPPGAKLALSKAKEMLTGKPIFSGEVTAEMKLSDSQNGEVYFAAVDRRVGSRLGGGWKSWTDAEAAFRYWAEKIRYTLCMQFRHGTDCVAPKE